MSKIARKCPCCKDKFRCNKYRLIDRDYELQRELIKNIEYELANAYGMDNPDSFRVRRIRAIINEYEENKQ